MNNSKQLLYANNLKVGMIPVNDIMLNNTVLVSHGTPLTESMINRLSNGYFYHKKIEVYTDVINKENKPKEEDITKTKTMLEVDSAFNELSNDLVLIFDTINNLKTSNIDFIRQFVKKLEANLDCTNYVVKNIIIDGSKNDTIYRHSINVAALSTILGRWLGLPNEQLKLLTYSALLHDLGKTKIDKAILEKPSTLTQKEYETIKLHPVTAYNYIKEIPYLNKSVGYGVLMHHERLDGSGYPLKLKGDNISQFARIIAIADVFDAINSDRAYKKSATPIESLVILQQESLHKLDYKYCKVFLEHVLNYYIGENVLLNTNEVCKILNININDLANPMIVKNDTLLDFKHNKHLQIVQLL